MHKAMLDNNVVSVIQYHGIEYRCEREEYCFIPFREFGSSAASPNMCGKRESASGSGNIKSEK